MFYSSLQVIIPLLGLIINVFVQIFGFRYISKLTLLKSVFLGFFIGFFSVVILEFYIFFNLPTLATDSFYVLVTNFITYSSLGYCYFHFINLGETARRIRILRELYDSKEGLSMKEILERYNARNMVEMRINRLVNNGQILYKNDRYYIGKPVMLLMAKTMIMMKLIVLGKASEFD